LKNN